MANRVLFAGALMAALGLASLSSILDAHAKPDGSKLKLHALSVNARVIERFSQSDRRDQRYGALKFRGGLVLTSADPAFGGFSGLEVSTDGTSLLAVSDAGAWLSAKIVYSGGRLTGISNARVGPLVALSAKRLLRGRDRDAEAVRLYSGTLTKGIALVSFERNERIGFFNIVGGDLKAPVRYLRPPLRLARNKGLEATAVIQGGARLGTVVAFAERTPDARGHHQGWFWPTTKQVAEKHASIRRNRRKVKLAARKPSDLQRRPQPIFLRNKGGFDITDMAGDEVGNLYILERRFRWSEGVKMRIRRIDASELKSGAVLVGTVLISADLGSEIDNMEGMALHRDSRGRTVLTLISDNNFNSFLQRNLLLQFEVVSAKK